MPSSPNIRWSNNQKKKFANAVRKFNAKVTREFRKHPEFFDFLPNRIDINAERANIKTAKDLNQLIARVERAFRPGAFKPIVNQQGVKTTKYELNEIRIGVQRINRFRKKELEALAPSTDKGTMGSIQENNLKPKQFDFNEMSLRNWPKFVESVEKQQRSSYGRDKMEQYKQNYLRQIEDVLYSPITADIATEFHDLVNSLDPETVYLFAEGNPRTSFDFFYDPHEAEYKLTIMFDNWKAAYGRD